MLVAIFCNRLFVPVYLPSIRPANHLSALWRHRHDSGSGHPWNSKLLRLSGLRRLGWGISGVKGSGWIEVPDEPQANPQENQADNAEATRQAAEAERQRALAEQRKKAQEEAARRQAEFEKNKQEALSSMKGIAENELGLKGISTSDDSGLKGIGEPKVSVLGLKGVGDPAPPRRGRRKSQIRFPIPRSPGSCGDYRQSGFRRPCPATMFPLRGKVSRSAAIPAKQC